jgi:hypothetical protein
MSLTAATTPQYVGIESTLCNYQRKILVLENEPINSALNILLPMEPSPMVGEKHFGRDVHQANDLPHRH